MTIFIIIFFFIFGRPIVPLNNKTALAQEMIWGLTGGFKQLSEPMQGSVFIICEHNICIQSSVIVPWEVSHEWELLVCSVAASDQSMSNTARLS